MRAERIFKLILLASLGLIGFACVPNTRVQPVPPPMPSAQIEIDSVQQVESINSGKYKPYELPSGDESAKAPSGLPDFTIR